MTFEILQLPNDVEGAKSFVEGHKAFRLLALKTAPEAFASNYEREAAFTDDVWLKRLTSPEAASFIARQDGQTVSVLTLIGPLPYGPEELSSSSNPWELPTGRAQQYAHFRFNGMFTLPEARGQGIAKALIKRGLEYGVARASEAGIEFIGSIAAERDNIPAKSLYEKCGFVAIREDSFLAHGRTTEIILMKCPWFGQRIRHALIH
ncbi:hypothetical protein B0O99DRAFT_650233 [Bisporella sp. PMI_857]|nr:hypothetical protein B0O99DRAFT_650233 [Bisporella sp. PMI_857]